MTTIKITPLLFKFKYFELDKLRPLLQGFNILELSLAEDVIILKISETVNQSIVDAMISQIQTYILTHLIKGEIVE